MPRQDISSDALIDGTGKDLLDWFAIVDDWGGAAGSHAEIVAYLASEHHVDGWWAQMIAVEYEQERGLPVPGRRADGTFAATAAVTVAVGAEIVFDFWADEARRAEWSPETVMSLVTANRPHELRFDFSEDGSHVLVHVHDEGEHKSAVRVTHDGLSTPEIMVARKAFWRTRLEALKRAAEVYRPM